MNTQPEALQRIADLEAMHERGTIRRGHIDEMLSELRRLHTLNADLLIRATALLEALDRDLPHNIKHHAAGERFNLRAAIAKATR